jgi:hypothetical protein
MQLSCLFAIRNPEINRIFSANLIQLSACSSNPHPIVPVTFFFSLGVFCGLAEEVVTHYVLLTVAHPKELGTRPVVVGTLAYCRVPKSTW